MTDRTCSIEGCNRDRWARGWCGTHYRRWQRWGSPEALRPRVRGVCSAPGCGRPHARNTWCDTHAAQMDRWGELRPLSGAPRPVRDGMRECRICDTWIPVAEFPADKGSKYGIKASCYPCTRAEYDAWKAANPTYFTEWQRANPDRMQAAVHKRRAARLGREHETISRLAVFQRDEYWCGICDGPIDAQAKWPHPRSASLDHIVPLNRGGTHTYANVQAACFYCNCQKGDRLESEMYRA